MHPKKNDGMGIFYALWSCPGCKYKQCFSVMNELWQVWMFVCFFT